MSTLNKERASAKQRARYEADPDKYRDRSKQYRAANLQKIAARNKAYRNARLDKVRGQARALYAANREKILARNKALMVANPGRARAQNLKFSYGITSEQFGALLDKQGGVCAICGTASPGGKGRFNVDHCHASNKIRGLLCGHCNTALGLVKDSIETARAVVTYLVQANFA